ncbi:MAG: hypothetical protein AAFO74_02270 [Pseudomonadota bacterium]
MSKTMVKRNLKAYDLLSDIKAVFANIPSDLTQAKVYPAGLNFCEIHLLSRAIQENYSATDLFRIDSKKDTLSVPTQELDVDYLYSHFVNEYGTGVEIHGPADSFFFKLQRDSVFAVLAGSEQLITQAIPFPNDIWNTYFLEIMQGSQSKETADIVLEAFNNWSDMPVER